MKSPQDIIKGYLVTEKSTELRETLNRHVFEVHRQATKLEIKDAVEALFQVKVSGVHTAILPRKRKRLGKHVIGVPPYKKAYVTLSKDSKLEVGAQ